VVANSIVPKITVISGQLWGGALCAVRKAYDRDHFRLADCEVCRDGGASAAKTLADIRIRQEEQKEKKLSTEEKDRILTSIAAQYAAALDPRYAAARLWVDKIISPWRPGMP